MYTRLLRNIRKNYLPPRISLRNGLVVTNLSKTDADRHTSINTVSSTAIMLDPTMPEQEPLAESV